MSDHTPYAIRIEWDAESDCYLATVPSLPGCMSHGETYETAAANVREAIEGWLATAQAHGDTIPEPDIALEELRRWAPVLNLSALARRAGVNKHTLATKLRRGTRLSADEATKIRGALAL